MGSLRSCTKMCGPPCFTSVFGLPLQKAVYIIALVELIITVLVTIANVVKYSKGIDSGDIECEGKDVCIGPILCSVLLLIGAKLHHRCLLIFWLCITAGCSIKYLIVFIGNDWTSLEDWVSISYLLFYTLVTMVVVAFMKQCSTTNEGAVHYSAPPPYKA